MGLFADGFKELKKASEQLQKDVLPSSDYVVDGTLGVDDLVGKILEIT